MEPFLRGHGLLRVAEMLPAIDSMGLGLWNRASQEAVQKLHPVLDLPRGCMKGSKMCITWPERRQEMKLQEASLERVLTELRAGRPLPFSTGDLMSLCEQVRRRLLREPNIVNLQAPMIVVGDLHGQLQDLLQILAIGGSPPGANYLFLGDIVNRGQHSCEITGLLMLLIARYPGKVTLLRGSSESRTMTQFYGFYDECLRKYGAEGPHLWREFSDLFDCLPVAAVISNRIYCVHGGLSPHQDSEEDWLDVLTKEDRRRETPMESPLLDILWAVPDDRAGWNMPLGHGSGYCFGPDVTRRFLQCHGFEHLVRSHCLVQNGVHRSQEEQVITVFSAGNYRARCGNLGGVLHFDEHLNCSDITYSSAHYLRAEEG